MLGQTRTDIASIRTGHFGAIDDRSAGRPICVIEKGSILVCAGKNLAETDGARKILQTPPADRGVSMDNPRHLAIRDQFAHTRTTFRETDSLYHEGI